MKLHIKELLLKTTTAFTIVISLFVFISMANTPLVAASIAQGYTTTDSELIVGMAASLNDQGGADGRNVERAVSSTANKFVGIVTTKDANLVTLTDKASTVVVTTSGEANGYLTTLNGDIKKGDYLAISPLKGILMKASSDEANAIGTALEDLSLSSASTQEVNKSDGGKQTVKVASGKIEINPTTISLAKSDGSKSFIRLVGEGLTGKTVSNWQVITAMIVFMILLIIEGSLVYGAIHATIIALGRNPLAHDAVYRQLLQVLLVVLGVLAFGIATIYAVLQI